MISRETLKQENSSTNDQNINLKGSTTTTSWSRLKDPRVVRVSRAFGGKDRHSKVCTVRGLRDRRVRLSVPTAIQLYDLQDRLGLNQPSKVVDWLLNAAKNEIDELPPLHFPQGGFGAALLPMLNNNTTNSDKQALISAGKSKDEDHASPETREREENNWTRSSDQEQGRHDFNLGINQDNHSYENQNQNPSSLQSLMNGTASSIPYNSFVRWDPSNLTLSHPPRSPPHQGEQDWHNFSLSHPHHHHHHHHHQVLVYQPAAGMNAAPVQPYFQSQISTSNAGFDTKHINFQNSHLSTSSPAAESSTLPARPIHFNMTANLLPSQNNDDRG